MMNFVISPATHLSASPPGSPSLAQPIPPCCHACVRQQPDCYRKKKRPPRPFLECRPNLPTASWWLGLPLRKHPSPPLPPAPRPSALPQPTPLFPKAQVPRCKRCTCRFCPCTCPLGTWLGSCGNGDVQEVNITDRGGRTDLTGAEEHNSKPTGPQPVNHAFEHSGAESRRLRQKNGDETSLRRTFEASGPRPRPGPRRSGPPSGLGTPAPAQSSRTGGERMARRDCFLEWRVGVDQLRLVRRRLTFTHSGRPNWALQSAAARASGCVQASERTSESSSPRWVLSASDQSAEEEFAVGSAQRTEVVAWTWVTLSCRSPRLKVDSTTNETADHARLVVFVIKKGEERRAV